MSKLETNSKHQNSKSWHQQYVFDIRDFNFQRSFGVSHFEFPRRERAFTVLELLVVIAIIIVLAGLLLATSGYVQKKGARSRAEAEIAAMSAACESYKADNGVYPTDPTATESWGPSQTPTGSNPTNASFKSGAIFLYRRLSGDIDGNPSSAGDDEKNYLAGALNKAIYPYPPDTTTFLRDPFGNPYGYSTAQATSPANSYGYNPTFDLWSTAGTTTGSATDRAQWIKNW